MENVSNSGCLIQRDSSNGSTGGETVDRGEKRGRESLQYSLPRERIEERGRERKEEERREKGEGRDGRHQSGWREREEEEEDGEREKVVVKLKKTCCNGQRRAEWGWGDLMEAPYRTIRDCIQGRVPDPLQSYLYGILHGGFSGFTLY